MAYPREEIDQVRERTDLGELAAEVTKVKRSGRSMMAVCPFHQEKTPSLSIDPARGLYHCFGCGKGGDVFQWVQEIHGLDFRESVEHLARRAGVTLTEEPGADKRRYRREELLRATAAAAEFFHERLKSGNDAAAARSYLRGRGYDTELVAHFKIGYAPDTWDTLIKHLKARGFSTSTLLAAGLTGESSQGRPIDRFRGRVMFPIYDLRGDPVGFGARLLEGDGPKYLNSPETSIYHKGSLLYGLNWAKGEIVRQHRVVVVEGYTDVIALHMAGEPIAVATCGTALGDEHLDLMRRFTDRIVLAFDADAAGADAAVRGFERSVPGDLDLRVAILPAGLDPADLVSAGEVEALRKAIDESTPLLQFRIERELDGFDLNEAEARGRAVGAAAGLVALHADPVVRHEYCVLLARRTGVDLEVVEEAVARSVRSRRGVPEPRHAADPRLTGAQKAELELMRLVLANASGLRQVDLSADLFADLELREAFERLWPAIMALAPDTTPELGKLLGDSSVDQRLRAAALDDRPLDEPGELVNTLKVTGLERRIGTVQHVLENLDPDTDQQEYSDRFAELIALQRRRQEMRGRE